MRCYLFDIDGTVADLSHRLHHIAGDFDEKGMTKPKNWKAFFAACPYDEPIPHVIEMARHLSKQAKIVFVSGRSDECRTETIHWLGRNGLPLDGRLYMRKGGDHRPDNIIKGELLDQILADGYEPIMAFDDRDQVVKMWRERGIPCAQVAEGAF